MTTPAFLVGAALIFWGWRIDAIWIALPMAALIEGSRWIRTRFEFSQNDLDRIWNLCVMLFAGSAVVAFALNDGFDAVGGAVTNGSPAQRMEMFNKGATTAIQFLQYLPATLLPIVLAQAFARQPRFPWSTFSMLLRKRRADARNTTPAGTSGLNVSHPFLGVVLFASALSASHPAWFLPGFAMLLVWGLWSIRPKAFATPAWGMTLLLAIGVGVAAQFGLFELQRIVRQLDDVLMARLSGGGKGYDPKGTRTRLGSIGGLKQSGQIIYRVESKENPPPLLREASYDLFKAPLWASSRRAFERTLPDVIDSSWRLVPRENGSNAITISTYLAGGKGLLALPSGSVRLTELPVFLLQTNSHGAVQVEEGPGFVQFNAHFRDGPSLDVPPNPDDTHLPLEEREMIQQVAADLQLDRNDPQTAVRTIQRHFANHFQYALWRGEEHQANSNRTALAAFLQEHRSGHCEYFATATTLLLRAAGIPARYAVGYAVQEKKGRFHIVRSRHAHAWAMAWQDGRWQDIDTTPGSWLETEASRAAFWEPLYDAWSRLWFEFSKWRWGPTDWKRHLVWLVVPLLILVGIRIVLQKQWRKVGGAGPGNSHGPERPGLDSELYLIERHLHEIGLTRETGETTSRWIRRAQGHGHLPAEVAGSVLDLHYRLRFDPDGLNALERSTLRAAVQRWLATEAGGKNRTAASG